MWVMQKEKQLRHRYSVGGLYKTGIQTVGKRIRGRHRIERDAHRETETNTKKENEI